MRGVISGQYMRARKVQRKKLKWNFHKSKKRQKLKIKDETTKHQEDTNNGRVK